MSSLGATKAASLANATGGDGPKASLNEASATKQINRNSPSQTVRIKMCTTLKTHAIR
jgi:hypothetical protein